MPIHAGNEHIDILGEVVKRTPALQNEAYDPRQWQDAENGRAKNRVLMHGSGNDAVEVREPEPPISRMIPAPKTVQELEAFFADNPDVSPEAVNGEIAKIKSTAPGFDPGDTFNLAVKRVCDANNLPLTRPAPAPEAMKIPGTNDEMARLEMEARKVRTEVGQDFAPVRAALQETTPKPRGRR